MDLEYTCRCACVHVTYTKLNTVTWITSLIIMGLFYVTTSVQCIYKLDYLYWIMLSVNFWNTFKSINWMYIAACTTYSTLHVLVDFTARLPDYC